MRPLTRWFVAIVALGAAASAGSARADDGGIAFGGAPKLLDGHPSVRMANEIVRMDVRGEIVTTTCDFWFLNAGKTCRVRMGFPDEGIGAYNPDEEMTPGSMKQPLHSTFLSFVSYVGGKKAPTRLIRSNMPGQYWHAKTVTFPAHRSLHIRDVYTQQISDSIARKGSYDSIRYILHTGSSWHGTIGHCVLEVIFHGKDLPSKLTAMPVSSDIAAGDWTRMPRGKVFHDGFGKPAVIGHMLRFEKSDWRPTRKDDVTLYFKA